MQHCRKRLKTGIQQLTDAKSLVGTMQEELVALGPAIVQKAKETETLLARLEEDHGKVEQVRTIVKAEEEVMQQETAVVQKYAEECEQDLASVVPALQEAILALDALNAAAISEVRVYNSPPALVKQVMAAVCILLNQPVDWKHSKALLMDPGFLRNLINYDKNNLSDRTFHRLKKITSDPKFNPKAVGDVSKACESICQWVLALEHYNEVHKMVKPKQRRVEEAKEALLKANENLVQKQARLTRIQAHLDALEQRYHESVAEREALQQRQELTQVRLARADLLIQALQGEEGRWKAEIAATTERLHSVLGDTLVAAGAVAYFGALSSKFRRSLIEEWIEAVCAAGVVVSSDFDLVGSQFDASQRLLWRSQNLPQDRNSEENAVFLKKSRRWCLLIDPQQQGLKFLRGVEGEMLKVVRATDSGYLAILERSISVGDPVVLTEVGETLDPTILPILRQDTYYSGGHKLMKVGENEIEYNDSFRLYLTTSLSNPHYLPAVSILVTIIDFTVTFDGLQEQLLSSVVGEEKPELEEKRAELMTSLAHDKALLRELEDRTLGLLQKDATSILDEEDLPANLEQSKAMSLEIGGRVAMAEAAEEALREARRAFLPVATRGAVLYFVLADLTRVNFMYQFSLDNFRDMFVATVCATPPGDDLASRLEDMIARLTLNTYRNTSVALFSEHQLVFSFLLCTSVLRAEGKGEGLALDDWNLFLHGPILADRMSAASRQTYKGSAHWRRRKEKEEEEEGETKEKEEEKKEEESAEDAAKEEEEELPPLPFWVSDEQWKQCQHAESFLPAFAGLCSSLRFSPAQWAAFYDHLDPFLLMTSPPEAGEEAEARFSWERLSDFQRVTLIKVLRFSRLEPAVRHFVDRQMGGEYLFAGQASLTEVFKQSEAKQPIIFLLAPGGDPSTALHRLAKEVRGSVLHLDMISLGRGQSPKAEELIHKAQILKGRWIFLQNCDLAASWLPQLQKICENLHKTHGTDKQFRLFLSSKPDPKFPISLLHFGLKMAIESPRGLKNILLRTFASDGTGLVSASAFDAAPPLSRRLLFALCLFNAVVLERRRYRSLGWNRVYEFNDSDLEVALQQVHGLAENDADINWQAVHYQVGEITYGGRVTEDWDRRCLRALLRRYQGPQVLEDGHEFTADGLFRTLPADADFAAARATIQALPESAHVSAFGLGINADRAFLEGQSSQLVESVLSVQPRIAAAQALEASSETGSNDSLVLETLRMIEQSLPISVESVTEEDADTLRRLGPKPKLRDAMATDKKRASASSEPALFFSSALHTVLRQEIDRFDAQLRVVLRTSRRLRAAIAGDEVMTGELESAFAALLVRRVPSAWSAYASCKPLGAWVRDLNARLRFLGLWAERLVRACEAARLQGSDAASADPAAYWLPSFAFPQGFLTGVLQNHARAAALPVDALTLAFQVTNRSFETQAQLADIDAPFAVREMAFRPGAAPPSEGVLIFGLFVDNAAWDLERGLLVESVRGRRLCKLPEIHLRPVTQQGFNAIEESEGEKEQRPSSASSEPSKQASEEKLFPYLAPVYRTSQRQGSLTSTGHSTNFVCTIELPSNREPDVWILRGTALLTQPELA